MMDFLDSPHNTKEENIQLMMLCNSLVEHYRRKKPYYDYDLTCRGGDPDEPNAELRVEREYAEVITSLVTKVVHRYGASPESVQVIKGLTGGDICTLLFSGLPINLMIFKRGIVWLTPYDPQALNPDNVIWDELNNVITKLGAYDASLKTQVKELLKR